MIPRLYMSTSSRHIWGVETAPLILDFGARRSVVVTPRAIHTQERKPVPIECALVGPRSGLDVLEKKMKIRFYGRLLVQGCTHFPKI
jgi:hypothetical protein